jgi:hypothetical protein
MNIFDKKYKYYVPLGMVIFLSTIVIWVFCLVCSTGIPYLLNREALIPSWFYFALPCFFIFFIYIIFFYKCNPGKRSYFQINHTKAELANPNFKAKRILVVLFWALLGAISFASMTWAVLACGAYIYSKQPVTQEFVVNDLRRAGKYNINVWVVGKENGTQYSLNQRSRSQTGLDWQIGDTVCAKGRTSIFGTIVEDFKIGAC